MKTILLVLTIAVCSTAHSQSKWLFENYNYIKQPGAGSFVPMLHFETKNNWYGEVRYNYEDDRTISAFAGRTIAGGKTIPFSITPMVGFSAGQFTGVTLATNIDLEWKNFYLSAQSQYSKAIKTTSTSFFFNWSELGYSASDHVFGGVAIQYTKEKEGESMEPGFFAGLSFKNVSIPFYVFSPFRSERYFVLGLNIEYSLHKRKRK